MTKDLGETVGILATRYKEEGGFSWGVLRVVCAHRVREGGALRVAERMGTLGSMGTLGRTPGPQGGNR